MYISLWNRFCWLLFGFSTFWKWMPHEFDNGLFCFTFYIRIFFFSYTSCLFIQMLYLPNFFVSLTISFLWFTLRHRHCGPSLSVQFWWKKKRFQVQLHSIDDAKKILKQRKKKKKFMILETKVRLSSSNSLFDWIQKLQELIFEQLVFQFNSYINSVRTINVINLSCDFNGNSTNLKLKILQHSNYYYLLIIATSIAYVYREWKSDGNMKFQAYAMHE